MPPRKTAKNDTAANVGYEAQLWQMADALRGSMDPGEYKHVVLGLIFLKYISDAFEEKHERLLAETAPLSLSDIARRLGLSPSSTLNLMRTLVAEGAGRT